MACGIYVIRNTKTSKVYVGSSVHIEQRFRAHKSLLRREAHSNQHLQNSWSLHGSDCFVFEIIEECELVEEVLLVREQHWLDEFKATDPHFGYNLVTDVVRNSGWKHSEEAKRKIGLAGTGRTKRLLTEEEREKVGERTRGKSYSELYGEDKAMKMREWNARPYEERFGKEVSEKLKSAKRGSFEDLYGEEKAAEIRSKMSKAKQGKPHLTDKGKESLRQSKLAENNPMYLSVGEGLKEQIISEYRSTGVVTKAMSSSFGLSPYKIRRILKESGEWGKAL